MRAAFATLALAGFAVATPAPQAVTSAIAPQQSPPAGCYQDYDGSFLIGPVNVSSSSKRDLGGLQIIETRNTKLGITLKGGILTDPQGRTGYIASNQQFQFDGPPQAGAIWTAGFSVCENNRLVLGNDDTWWKCLSGDFYNLYYKSIGGQCIESYLITRPEPGSGGPISSAQSETGSIATTPAEPSASGSASASGSGSGNATATASGSASASSSSMMTASASSSGATTVGGGHTTNTKGTMTGGTMTTGGGATNTGTGNGSPTGAAASSSSSPGAAPMATLKGEMMGLAAGVLAMAVL